jgi:hypothetical protein
MAAPTNDEHERRRARLSLVGTVEGHLAPVVVLIGLVPPRFWPPIPDLLNQGIGITVWALAWLLSISGTRFGKGGGRVVAALTLALLTLHGVTMLIIEYH